MKTCYFCRGPVEPGVVDHMAHRGSKYVLIRGLKAEVCGQCGEVYLDLAASRCVDAALVAMDRAEERMTVPVVAAGLA